MVLCNVVSYWLSAYTEQSMISHPCEGRCPVILYIRAPLKIKAWIFQRHFQMNSVQRNSLYFVFKFQFVHRTSIGNKSFLIKAIVCCRTSESLFLDQYLTKSPKFCCDEMKSHVITTTYFALGLRDIMSYKTWYVLRRYHCQVACISNYVGSIKVRS